MKNPVCLLLLRSVVAASGAFLVTVTPTSAQTAPVPAKDLPPVTLESFNVSAGRAQSYQADSVQRTPICAGMPRPAAIALARSTGVNSTKC